MLLDLLLPACDLRLAAVPLLPLGLDEGAVVAGVEVDGFVVDVQDVGGHVVEEPVVVGDHHGAFRGT